MPETSQPPERPQAPEAVTPSPSTPASVAEGQGTSLSALLFVVAPESSLPSAPASIEELEAAQRSGIGSAMGLRMYRVPAGWSDSLDDLVSEGLADVSGADPFASFPPADPAAPPERRRLICDAVVPHLEARSHWIGVYAVEGEPLAGDRPAAAADAAHPCRSLAIRSLRCLDRFALREADNETCWFYPTDDGTFLAWENQRRVRTRPGYLPERPTQSEAVSFQRSDLRVLWSLMADDLALTCVGLTCKGRRIEWPVIGSEAEPFATWTAFQVDSTAESSYSELAAITVFQG